MKALLIRSTVRDNGAYVMGHTKEKHRPIYGDGQRLVARAFLSCSSRSCNSLFCTRVHGRRRNIRVMFTVYGAFKHNGSSEIAMHQTSVYDAGS